MLDPPSKPRPKKGSLPNKPYLRNAWEVNSWALERKERNAAEQACDGSLKHSKRARTAGGPGSGSKSSASRGVVMQLPTGSLDAIVRNRKSKSPIAQASSVECQLPILAVVRSICVEALTHPASCRT